MENLEAVRASGLAVSNQDVVLGMAAVGAPVFDHDGRVCAAVSISGPVATILDERRERSCSLVATAARKISQSLGMEDPTALGARRARA
jgi:IclR family transcriptional regulator, KDG regulon repressor